MPARPVAVTMFGVELTGTTEFMRQLHQVLANNQITLNTKDLNDRIKQAGKDFEKSVRSTAKLAFGDDTKKRVADIGLAFRDSIKKTSALRIQLARSGVRDEEKARINAQLLHHSRARKALNVQLKTERVHFEKAAKFKQTVHRNIEREADAGSKSRMVAFARGVVGVYSDLKSGRVGGIASRGLGFGSKALRGGGGKLGGMGGGAASMGKVVTGLGLAVGAIGGLVTAIGLLMKLFFDMDKQIKDMNKSLIQAGGAYNYLGARGAKNIGELEKRLNLVRKAAHDTSNNLEWMTMPKEQLGIISALGEAGYGINKILEGTKNETEQMKKLHDATSMVLVNARQLGMESTAVAKDMASFMIKTGSGLNEVKSGFTALIEAASQSGFSMKRFYSTILESTSGLFYYNQRLAKAAELLGKVQGILGERAGTEFYKSINQGFVDMDYKTRFKQVITSGKAGQKVFAAASRKATADVGDMLSKNVELSEAVGVRGVDPTKDIIAQLAKMTETEFAKYSATVRARLGQDPKAGQQVQMLATARERRRAVGGGIQKQAIAMGGFAGGESMALKMANFIKPLHKMSALQLAAYEEFKGISGAQLEMLRRVSRDFHGQFGVLQEMQKSGNIREELNKQMAKTMKLAIVDGQIVKADLIDNEIKQTGGVIKTVQDAMINSAKEINAVTQSNEDKQLMLAQKIVQQTEPLQKILSITIAGLLADIRGYVKPLEMILLKTFNAATFGQNTWAQGRIASRETQDKLQLQADEHVKQASDKLARVKETVESVVAGISDPEKRAKEEERLKRTYVDTAQAEVTAAERLKSKISSPMVDKKMKELTTRYMKEGLDEDDARDKAQRTILNEQTHSIKDITQQNALNNRELIKEEKLSRFENSRDLGKIVTAVESTSENAVLLQQTMDELKRIGYTGSDIYSAAKKYVGADERERMNLASEFESQAAGFNNRFPSHFRGMTAEDKARAGGIVPESMKFRLGGSVDDFIITNSGKLIKPSAQDAIFGMKPGGPISKAMGGRGSGGANINVTIYESHDTQKTYNTVKRVLEAGGLI